MDINKIIIILIVAIAVCLAILIYFVITDKLKRKSVSKAEDQVPLVADESLKDKKDAKESAIKEDSAEKLISVPDNLNKEKKEIDPDGVTEILTSNNDESEEPTNKEAKVEQKEPTTTEIQEDIKSEDSKVAEDTTQTVTKKRLLNPLPVIKTATKTADDSKKQQKETLEQTRPEEKPQNNSTAEVGFVGNSEMKDSVMKLLQSIAEELSKRANNEERTCINYLEDTALDLKIENGYFLLNNEEVMRNGIIQDGDVFDIYAGDRVVIRFCVNFAVPAGYDVQVVSDITALRNKGLAVKDIICPKASSLSIRAILQAEKSCKISKTDKLFKVHILQEVVQ